MAKFEAGEFVVSKQGETMHVIGKVARLNWHCANASRECSAVFREPGLENDFLSKP